MPMKRKVYPKHEKIAEKDCPPESPPAPPAAQDKKSGEDLKDELDALLDEIDEVLEENAEAFVRNFVQKGGQAARVVLNWVGRATRERPRPWPNLIGGRHGRAYLS